MAPTSETPIPMGIALSEIQRASRNARRFWNLPYAVGTATTMALIVGILLATLGHSVQVIVIEVVTLPEGAGSIFSVKMKNGAVEKLGRVKSTPLEHWKGAGTTRLTTQGVGEGMGDLIESLMSIIQLRGGCQPQREGPRLNTGSPPIWIALVRLREVLRIVNRGEDSADPGSPLTRRRLESGRCPPQGISERLRSTRATYMARSVKTGGVADKKHI